MEEEEKLEQQQGQQQDATAEDQKQPEASEQEALGEGAKKALVSERKARREAEAELAKLREAEKERERASMTQAEQEKARADELQAELNEYRTRAMRADIAAEAQVPPALAKWIVGGTAEEMRANADELMEAVRAGFVQRAASADADATGAGKRGQADGRTPQELAAEVMQR